MAEATETPQPTVVEIPAWAKWLGGIVGGGFLSLMVAGVWGLLGGGLDSYVDGRANDRIVANLRTAGGTTLEAEVNDLVIAVNGLTGALQASNTINTEFRTETRDRLGGIETAIRELARPRQPGSG